MGLTPLCFDFGTALALAQNIGSNGNIEVNVIEGRAAENKASVMLLELIIVI